MGFKSHIIEMDTNTWSISGDTVLSVEKFEAVRGDKLLVYDFPSSLSRVMTVDAPVKYAETMVIRKLQEEGEFDESVTVLSHWKKKRGKKSTQIFFTAVGTHTYLRLKDRINEHEDTVILFPLYQVLFNFIKKIPAKSPIAVVFRHDRFADVVIGTPKRVYFASRCTAFDTSPEQTASLWEMITGDIETVQKEADIEIEQLFFLNWMDTAAEHPPDIPGNAVLTFHQEPVFYEGTTRHISFLKAVRLMSVFSGDTGPAGWLFYFTRKFSYLAILIFFLASLALAGIYLKYDKENSALDSEIKTSLQRVSQMKKTVSIKPVNETFKSVFDFVNMLHAYQNAPSFEQIVFDLETGLFQPAIIETLKINYSEKDVKIEIYGTIASGFDTAYKRYQAFLKSLETKGYTIGDSHFNTQISQSEFKLTFSRSLP